MAAPSTCAHAVEIYNHGCAIENDRGEGWYLLDQLLTEGKRLTAFATDDAHFKTPDYFGGWVHVKAESLDPEALLAALKQGHYYSSQGPQFQSIELQGKEISIGCSPVDTITVVCGHSRTCVRTGKAITEASFDLKALERGWLLKKPSPWFRVTVIDHAGKRAWRTPSGGMKSPDVPLWRVISGLGITQIIGWGTTYYLLGALSPDFAAATGLVENPDLRRLLGGPVAERRDFASAGRAIDKHRRAPRHVGRFDHCRTGSAAPGDDQPSGILCRRLAGARNCHAPYDL